MTRLMACRAVGEHGPWRGHLGRDVTLKLQKAINVDMRYTSTLVLFLGPS